MSGPKSATYYLTAAQRAALAEQRRRQLERKRLEEERRRQEEERRRIEKLCREERQKISEQKAVAKRYLGAFSSELKEASELLSRTGNGGDFSKTVREFEKSVSLLIDTDIPANASLDELKKITAQIGSKIQTIKLESNKIKQAASENKKALVSNLNSSIAKGFSFDISALEFNESTLKEDVSTDELASKMIASLSEYESSEVISDKLKESVSETVSTIKEINDKGFLKNYGAITVLPLIKKCKAKADEYKECKTEYETLITEYITLCETAERKPEAVKCSYSGIAFLREQIKILTEQIAKADEEEYISRAVDEVMSEMGYDILGYRENERKNLHFHHDLYRYGDGTAVNVTFSSDGKISMELGGLDSVDRIPDEDESQKLSCEMERFCGDFAEIEKRLAAKGVLVGERISILPPSAAYAQIINTADYKLKKQTEKFEIKKEKHTLKEKKALRKDM